MDSASSMLVDASSTQLECQQMHLRKNSISPPTILTMGGGGNKNANNTAGGVITNAAPGNAATGAAAAAANMATNSAKENETHSSLLAKMRHATSPSNNGCQSANASQCSSLTSSPSKLAVGGGYHQYHAHHHVAHSHGGNSHYALHHQHPHPTIASLKQCATLSSSNLCGVGCGGLSGSATPPLLQHTLFPAALHHFSTSGPSSLVNSPALSRRKRYTSTSSNCSSQFNNNYAGLDMESLDDMLRKVSCFLYAK